MTEQLPTIILTFEQETSLARIGDEALRIMAAQYGTGFPDYVEGSEANLCFHNRYHAQAVPEDGQRVGEALGFSRAEQATVDVAGKAHDIVQLKERGQMERESADWLVAELRREQLPEPMVLAGKLAIEGTIPVFDGNKVTGQQATRQEYPSKSAERVALAVACGDFGRMLTPIGPLMSHKYYQQIKGCAPGQAPPMDTFEQYLADQIAMREEYRFPLPAAERLLGTHRRQVVAYGEQVLRQLQRGDIESWHQLEAQDLEFMRSLAYKL
ncbi:MAG TPA: hypothetical protein VFB59_00320 [Candidatus Saccharimonadales bacterium]|nr:hypothetical protein [Candidatus Saccharimonadales bacterium]